MHLIRSLAGLALASSLAACPSTRPMSLAGATGPALWRLDLRPSPEARRVAKAGTLVVGWLDVDQAEAIRKAAGLIANSLKDGGVWHVFGTGHSHFLGEEVYYRAGGLVPVNAIFFPALMQHEGPATSTKLERVEGLAKIVPAVRSIKPGLKRCGPDATNTTHQRQAGSFLQFAAELEGLIETSHGLSPPM